MTKPLPKWEMIKYAFLWVKFNTKEFINNQASNVLNEKDNHLLSVLFYDLRRYGWLIIARNMTIGKMR